MKLIKMVALHSFSHARKLLLFIVLAMVSLTITPPYASSQDTGPVYFIEDTFNLALENHPAILTAERNIVKNKTLIGKARSEIMPKVNVFGFYRRLDDEVTSNNTIIEPDEKSGLDFSLSQPLFNASYRYLKEQAYGEVDTSLDNYFHSIQNVLFQVAEAYYAVLEAEEHVQNSQNYITLATEELRVASIKYYAGSVTEDAKINAELSVTKAQGNMIESKNNLKLSKDVIKSLVGIKEDKFVFKKPLDLHPVKETFEELYQKALEQRHDYQVALQDVKLSKSNINLSKSKFYPRLDSSVDYFIVKDPSFDEDSNYLVAELKLNIPLYEGGIRFSEIKEKAETLKQANFLARELRDNIKIELKRTLANINSFGSLLDNIKKQVELAKKTYQITKTQFNHGSATSLDLQQALAFLNTIETEEITTKYEYQKELLKLRKVVGSFVQEKLEYSHNE